MESLWALVIVLAAPGALPPAVPETAPLLAQEEEDGGEWGDDLLEPDAKKPKPKPKPKPESEEATPAEDAQPGLEEATPEIPVLDITPKAKKPEKPALEEAPDAAPGLEKKPRPRPKPKPKPEPAAKPEPPPEPKPAPAPEPRPAPAPGTRPAPAVEPEKPVAPREEPEAAAETVSTEPDFLVDLDGGVVILRGVRVQGLAGFGLGWNLGKLLGWPGLFLKADLDVIVGESPLGTDYLMFDALFGFLARVRLGPVCVLVDVGFGLRHMVLTSAAVEARADPEAGFGVAGGLGLEIPLGDLFSLHVRGDARYTRDPLSGRFELSDAVTGGVGFVF